MSDERILNGHIGRVGAHHVGTGGLEGFKDNSFIEMIYLPEQHK